MKRTGVITLVTALVLGVSAVAVGGNGGTGGKAGIRALDPSGRSCARADTGWPFVRGRCTVVAHDFDVDLSIRSVFGAIPFGKCSATFDITLDGEGRLWVDRIRIGGISPCGDIWPCAPDRIIARAKDPADRPPLGKMFPWRGRLVGGSGARFDARLDICLDTCAGRYEGELTTELVRGDHGWVLRADRAGVGRSGLSVDGQWMLDGGFRLRGA